jgi:ABC-type branched-subunit amino acid transport system substrate-binding protein
MIKAVCYFFILLSIYIYPQEFTTLKEFTDYARMMPEFPESDGGNWENPDYSTFHKQMIPGIKKKMIRWLRRESALTFPVQALAPLLDDVSLFLQKNVPEGRIVKKVSVDSGASFIIWTELNGAFHSLVRALNELHRQGILDDNLRIIEPLVHFVFAGDVSNKSPYLIETMFLVLRLMQMNPRCEGRNHEKVFYLKGKQEDRQEWLNTGLGRELRTRLIHNGFEKTPLETAFSAFFNRLPLALYLMQEAKVEKEVEAVRISYFTPEFSELEEDAFLYFFDNYSRPVISISQKSFQETNISLKIRAYIYAGGDIKKHLERKGLSLISKSDTKAQWTIFSSPTDSSRRLYQFFDDAFVRLDIGDAPAKWTLTLYHQDVRTLKGFVQERPVYLLSGEVIVDDNQQKVANLQKDLANILSENQSLRKGCIGSEGAATGEKESAQVLADASKHVAQTNTIVIGSTMDFSKQFKSYNESLKYGLNLVLDAFNKSGGAGGKSIQMVYLDDGYEPERARANIEKFLQDLKTNITFSSMGSPTLTNYLDLIKEKKVFVIFPNSGAFRQPDLKNIVHLRTSYIENGYTIAQYVAKNLKDKKVAFFYQNDAWGKDLFQGAQAAFDQAGIHDILEVPFVANSISFTKQVDKIKEFDPDAIAFFCNSKVAQEFIKEIGAEYLQGKVLFGDTVLGQSDFSAFLKEKGLKMIRVQVVPDPDLSQLEIVKEFREYAKKEHILVNSIALEGFINAAVLVDVIGHLKGDISVENIIKAIEGIKDYDFKGLKLNFDPETRQLLHTVWINDGAGDWIAQEVAMHKVTDQVTKESHAKSEAVVGKNAAETAALELERKAMDRLKTENSTLSSLQNKVLKIGSSLDLSKGVKNLSEGYRNGMMLKLDEINAAGGVNGINFQLNVMDDQYEPMQARANILEMMKEFNIDLLLAPVGTPTTKAYLDLIEAGKLLVLFPIARSNEYRRPDLINIIQYQMSLKQETEIITRFIHEKFKPKKLAIFYQNDEFGLEPKDEIERLAKAELPDLEVLAVSYERNSVSFKEQLAKIKNFKPDAIALQATSAVVEEFVRQIGAEFLFGKILFGGSWLMVDKLLKSIQDKGLDVNLVSSVPDPQKSEIELAEDFRKAAHAKGVPTNVIYFEGYLYMSLLAYAIQQIEAPYSKEKIINVFQNMKKVNFKGFTLNFNPETRVILQDAWIYATKDNSWTKVSISESKDKNLSEKSLEEKKSPPEPEKNELSGEVKKAEKAD